MTDWLTKRTKAYFTEATFAKKGRSSFFFYGGSLGHAYGRCSQIHWALRRCRSFLTWWRKQGACWRPAAPEQTAHDGVAQWLAWRRLVGLVFHHRCEPMC